MALSEIQRIKNELERRRIIEELERRGVPRAQNAGPIAPAPDPRIAQAEADPLSPAAIGLNSETPLSERIGRSPDEVPLTGAARSLMLGTQDVGRGAADTVAGPFDIANMLANLPLAGVEGGINLFRDEGSEVSLPRFRTDLSTGLAEDVGNIASAAGAPLVDRATLSPSEKLLSNINRLATGAITTGGLAAPRAAVSTFARSLAPQGAKELAVDTAAGAGAGAGLSAAETFAPDSPIASLFGTLLGGLGGAKTAQVTTAPVAAGRAIRNTFPDPDIPGVSRRTADQTAEIFQGKASDKDTAAATLRREADAAERVDDPTATSGILSDDIGLTDLEKRARKEAPVTFEEADQRVRDAAQERIGRLRDPEADPRAAQRKAEGDRAAARASAAEPLAQSRQELETLRTENTRLQTELEAERAGKLSSQTDEITTTSIDRDTAIKAEEDLGGTVQGRGDQKVAASEDISAQFNTKQAAADAERRAAFKEAEDLGRSEPVEGGKLAETAREIRADIEPVAEIAPAFRVLLKDLDALDPPAPKPAKDAKPGDPLPEPPKVPEVTVRSLSKMLPRVGRALAAAEKNLMGETAEALVKIQKSITDQIDTLVAGGAPGATKLKQARKDFGSESGFGVKFRDGVGGELTAAKRSKSAVNPSEVGEKFLGGGKEAAQDFNRILGSEGDVAARQFFLADMAKVVGSNGKINLQRLRGYITSREGLFQAEGVGKGLRTEAEELFDAVSKQTDTTTQLGTELKQQIAARRNTASQLQKQITEVKANSRLSEKQKQSQIRDLERNAAQVERDIQDGATSLLLDADPATAAREVFNARDPQIAMRKIVAKLKGDKEAAAGWREAVTQHLEDSIKGANLKAEPVSLQKLQKFFDKNAKAMAEVYNEPGEMNTLRRAHKILEPLGNLKRAVTGTPLDDGTEKLFRVMEAGLFATGHSAITIGMVMKRLKVASAFLPQKFRTAKLLSKTFFDPKLAALLLERSVSKIRAPAWNRRLTFIITGEATAREVDTEE